MITSSIFLAVQNLVKICSQVTSLQISLREIKRFYGFFVPIPFLSICRREAFTSRRFREYRLGNMIDLDET